MSNTSKLKRSVIAGVAVATALSVSSLVAVQSSEAAAKKITVSFIVKNTTNPFFVGMINGANESAKKLGITLKVGAGKTDGDATGQINLIKNAIASKQQGIIIVPNDPAVEKAMKEARKAGIYVIVLDTPPSDPTSADIVYATDNLAAGVQIGAWTAAKLNGAKAVISLLDLNPNGVSVDLQRDQGFLKGLGIAVPDATKNGSEAEKGKYTASKGGDYQVCNHFNTNATADLGQKGVENALAKCPDLNVVYAINEQTATGAYAALKAAGKDGKVLVLAIDGGKGGIEAVKKSEINATAQQYPGKMASSGLEAIKNLITKGVKAKPTPGLNFFNTGSNLITEDPQTGVDSKDAAWGLKNAW